MYLMGNIHVTLHSKVHRQFGSKLTASSVPADSLLKEHLIERGGYNHAISIW